jgi:hypothetical protein
VIDLDTINTENAATQYAAIMDNNFATEERERDAILVNRVLAQHKAKHTDSKQLVLTDQTNIVDNYKKTTERRVCNFSIVITNINFRPLALPKRQKQKLINSKKQKELMNLLKH